MSYINEALQKVQKEKESPYAPYGDIVSAEGKKPDHGRKRFSVIGLAIVFFYAAGMIVFLYWPEMNIKPRAATVIQGPIVATVQPLQDDAIEVKEEKQNVLIPAGGKKQEASPKPSPSDSGILYAQALQKQNKGKLEEAKALYKKVIKADPRHVSALNNLGVIFMNQKMYKQAVGSFNEALHVRSNYVDAHYNLACLYAQKNDTKQSLLYLKSAIDINPEAKQWAAQDDDLKVLVDLPEFNQLVQIRDK
ncbi:MAG: tetratricopeptide repeat protein [Smithellaceae bacterium]|nr:tetratricopeptide repeat protein [Smithellaceae bacterium]